MADKTISITLRHDEALVLDACIAKLFGENDLHDWDQMRLSFEQESEQWPFYTIRDALADQLAADLTAGNYFQLLENAHKSITAHQWGE